MDCGEEAGGDKNGSKISMFLLDAYEDNNNPGERGKVASELYVLVCVVWCSMM